MRNFGVLFDLDGTIHDRAAGVLAFASDQYRRIGTDKSLRDSYVHRFVELDSNGMVWKDQVYEVLLREFNLHENPSVQTLVTEYLQLFPKFSSEIYGARDALINLKSYGLKLGIITNGPAELQRAVIEAVGFDELVDVIVVSEEVGLRKPQREIFELAIGQLGVAASDVMMVGDSIKSDVEGALAAGIQPIAFGLTSAPKGVYLCQNLSEIVSVVKSKFLANGA